MFEEHIQRNRARFLSELQQLVRFPSVSAQPSHRADLLACADWVAKHFRDIGLQVTVHKTKGYPIIEARTPALQHSNSPSSATVPTVLIYGHYDVQPAEPLDLWKTDPFDPVVRDKKLYGRGASDNKGQFFAHVKAVESYLKTNTPLPVNVVFLIEGEEESLGSASLVTLVKQQAKRLHAETIIVSDTGMYSKDHPTLTYATRGNVGFEIRLAGPSRDLHSGVFGGSVANPALVLSKLLAEAVDENGHVTIPGFYKGVRALEANERKAWKALAFDEKDYRKFLGVPELAGEKGFTTLERRWARPTFEINGLTSGYQGDGGKTIVPAWASAKLTTRIVPDQDPDHVYRVVKKYFERRCPKSVRLSITGGGSAAFFTPPNGPGAKAALAALESAFGKKPVCTREGGTLPILDVFKRHLKSEILLLGLGVADDNWHSPNEKFNLDNFYNGIAMSAELLKRLGTRKKDL